jgi:hypothetical protein
MGKARQEEHLWRNHQPGHIDANQLKAQTDKAYKARRVALKARNAKLGKAIYHIEQQALQSYSRAATVLNGVRKELMAGELGPALIKFEKACELTSRLQGELVIIAKHLDVSPALTDKEDGK